MCSRFWTENGEDVHPSEVAEVIAEEVLQGRADLSRQRVRWGYPGKNGGLVINARAESVFEKAMFRAGIRKARVAVPAGGFYEWNVRKEKSSFRKQDHGILYLAGIEDVFGGERRFVLLTTEANASVKGVHSRMPLLLDREELAPWIFDDSQTEKLLMKVPALLERDAGQEQLSLF